jgi:hypothetical protein
MNRVIQVKEINEDVYMKYYNESSWCSPIQASEFSHAFLTTINDEASVVINTMSDSDGLILFICKISEQNIYHSVTQSIDKIMQKMNLKGIRRVMLYLWDREDLAEFDGALDDFNIEVEFRNHIRIRNEFYNVLLAVKHL